MVERDLRVDLHEQQMPLGVWARRKKKKSSTNWEGSLLPAFRGGLKKKGKTKGKIKVGKRAKKDNELF